MKKFYILTMLFALLGISQAWATYSKIANAQFNGIGGKKEFSWTADHATFTISTENNMSYTGAAGTQHMTINGNGAISITKASEGYTVTLTRFNFVFGNPGTSGKITINGEERTIGLWATNWGFDRTCSITDDKTLSVYTSKGLDIYSIELWYTVTPDGAPAVSGTEQTINVTLDANNLKANEPQTVEFGVPTTFADDVEFAVEPNSGFGHNKGLFYATVAGTYTVKARIAAKTDCHEASDWSDEVTVTVNRLNQTLSWLNEENIKTNMILGDEQTINATSTSGRAVTYTSDDTDVLTVDENGKLTAVAVGEATITVSRDQDDQYNAAESISKTFHVVKINPEFSPVDFVAEDSCAVRKNETATIELNNVSDGLEGDFTATPGDDKISVSREGNVLTIHALKVGVTTLTLSQIETGVLAEFSKTYKIEVLRLTNKIWVNGVENYAAEMHFNAHQVVEFASANEDEPAPDFVVEQLSGAEFATYEDGVIIASYRDGTATWKVSQPQSDNYEAAEAIFSMTVKPNEAMTGCNVLEDLAERSWSSQGNSGEYIFAIDAPGDILTFDAMRTDICVIWCLGNNTDWHIEYATTLEPGKNDWTDLPNGEIECEDKDQYYYGFKYALPEDARAIRFITANTGSFGNKFIKNVTVSRKAWLKAEEVELNLLPEEAGEGTLTVDYSLADGDELAIVTDNDLFTLDESVIAYESCSSGKVEIPVHFAATAELGIYKTNVTIYNAYYSKTVQLIANVKYTPVITWDDINLAYGEDSLLAAEVDIDTLAINYELVDENTDVISLVDGMIVAEKPGTAQVRAFTAATAQYNAAETTINVIVSKASQEIVWGMEADTILLEVNTERLVAVTATSGLDVEVTTSADSIVEVLENSYDEYGAFIGVFLKALLEGEATITASQPGDEYYEAAEQSWKIVVVKTCITGFENLFVDKQTVKVIRNGQVYILRDGKVYSITGMRVE